MERDCVKRSDRRPPHFLAGLAGLPRSTGLPLAFLVPLLFAGALLLVSPAPPASAQDTIAPLQEQNLFDNLIEATREAVIDESEEGEGTVLTIENIARRGVNLSVYERFRDINVPIFRNGQLASFGKVVFGIELNDFDALREFRAVRPRLASEFRDEMMDYLTTLPNQATPNVASIQRRIAYRIKRNIDPALVRRIIVEGVFRARVVRQPARGAEEAAN